MQHKNDVDGDDDDDDDANRGKKRIDRTKGSLQMRRGMRKMKQIFCTIIQDRSRCSCSVVGVLFILLCAVLMQFYILSHHTDTPNPVDRIRFFFCYLLRSRVDMGSMFERCVCMFRYDYLF